MAVCFITMSLDGDEWSPSCPGSFTSKERAAGRWIGSRVVLDAVREREMSYLSQKLNFSPLSIAGILTELFGLPKLK
jgi:hypothetical protein